METLKSMWHQCFLQVGIPSISIDTCARIFAVLHMYGNNEEFVYNKSFLEDVCYIQKRFKVRGGETPDAEFSELLKFYVKSIEEYEEAHKDDDVKGEGLFRSHVPQWALELFKERYNIKLI